MYIAGWRLRLAGQFTKYCNNTGFWDEGVFDPTLAAFVKWAYEITGGYLIVADLQGVKCPHHGFLLTDPVVLCTDVTRFGSTNLGVRFMNRVIETADVLLAAHS